MLADVTISGGEDFVINDNVNDHQEGRIALKNFHRSTVCLTLATPFAQLKSTIPSASTIDRAISDAMNKRSPQSPQNINGMNVNNGVINNSTSPSFQANYLNDDGSINPHRHNTDNNNDDDDDEDNDTSMSTEFALEPDETDGVQVNAGKGYTVTEIDGVEGEEGLGTWLSITCSVLSFDQFPSSLVPSLPVCTLLLISLHLWTHFLILTLAPSHFLSCSFAGKIVNDLLGSIFGGFNGASSGDNTGGKKGWRQEDGTQTKPDPDGVRVGVIDPPNKNPPRRPSRDHSDRDDDNDEEKRNPVNYGDDIPEGNIKDFYTLEGVRIRVVSQKEMSHKNTLNKENFGQKYLLLEGKSQPQMGPNGVMQVKVMHQWIKYDEAIAFLKSSVDDTTASLENTTSSLSEGEQVSSTSDRQDKSPFMGKPSPSHF